MRSINSRCRRKLSSRRASRVPPTGLATMPSDSSGSKSQQRAYRLTPRTAPAKTLSTSCRCRLRGSNAPKLKPPTTPVKTQHVRRRRQPSSNISRRKRPSNNRDLFRPNRHNSRLPRPPCQAAPAPPLPTRKTRRTSRSSDRAHKIVPARRTRCSERGGTSVDLSVGQDGGRTC